MKPTEHHESDQKVSKHTVVYPQGTNILLCVKNTQAKKSYLPTMAKNHILAVKQKLSF